MLAYVDATAPAMVTLTAPIRIGGRNGSTARRNSPARRRRLADVPDGVEQFAGLFRAGQGATSSSESSAGGSAATTASGSLRDDICLVCPTPADAAGTARSGFRVISGYG